MIKFKKAVSASVLSLGLVVGLAGFAGATSGTIGTTGPDSTNEVKSTSSTEMKVDNNNDLRLSNKNHQQASSGKTEVEGNTTGGSATSGDGANNNAVDAMVEIDNSQAVASLADIGTGGGSNTGSITNTGPDSVNKVNFENKVKVNVDNDNNISICNTNDQVAKSGEAEVEHNTTGGDATSGSVTNTSSSSFTVRVTN